MAKLRPVQMVKKQLEILLHLQLRQQLLLKNQGQHQLLNLEQNLQLLAQLLLLNLEQKQLKLQKLLTQLPHE